MVWDRFFCFSKRIKNNSVKKGVQGNEKEKLLGSEEMWTGARGRKG
jgi:hypothetical protein